MDIEFHYYITINIRMLKNGFPAMMKMNGLIRRLKERYTG